MLKKLIYETKYLLSFQEKYTLCEFPLKTRISTEGIETEDMVYFNLVIRNK